MSPLTNKRILLFIQYTTPSTMAQLPSRQLSKSKLSTFLRTKCDRHLYLSLFNNNVANLKAANLPVPLKTRPAVQLITKSGQDFEREQFDELTKVLPQNVIFRPGYAEVDLDATLSSIDPKALPQFILQPGIEPQHFRDYALDNLGLTTSEKQTIPPLSGLRPDILYVHKPNTNDYEVLPNGKRKLVTPADSRIAISVIDLKNVTEANASYAAEVCLYTFFLTNWLNSVGANHKDKYYVSHKTYLWKHTNMPNFSKTISLSNSTANHRIEALELDLQDGLVNYMIYFSSVYKFFKEDIPRVVTKGDTEGWASVAYHISSKCNACDWLGNEGWLFGEDLRTFEANPNHYCLPAAEADDHLCQLPNLSKGASSVLVQNGHSTLSNLVGLSPDTLTLKKHSLLKSDRSQISERARAINTGSISINQNAKFAGLAAFVDAEYDIIVNFDSGSGLLTGIALRGMLFAPFQQMLKKPDGSTASYHSYGEEAFVVEKDFLEAEWVALESFINKLAQSISTSHQLFNASGFGSVRTQICFWEPRQYEELCNAFGRHLLKVLSLPERSQRALAWLFPADELMEKDSELTPGIVFIRNFISQGTRLPVKFAHTLLGVAEKYHLPGMPPRKLDNYYREILGDSIPRERIFEIWKANLGVIPMYGKNISLSHAIKNYENALKTHAWALASVTAKLRIDLRDRLTSKAPILSLAISTGANSVAYDSKLWIQWDKVEASTAKTQSELELITDAESLEASYKIIVLPKMVQDLGNYRYKFEVSEDSTEAKLEEGKSFYVAGLVNHPGYPLQTGSSLGLSEDPPNIDFAKLRIPLHKIVAVTLENFDRINRIAIISLRPRSPFVEELFNLILSSGLLPLDREPIYLQEGVPYDDSESTKEILKEVGNPPYAKISNEAKEAMGDKAAKKIVRGTDPSTPIARVLWESDALSSIDIRTDAESQAISNYRAPNRSRDLNASQKDAVYNCARKQLSVIWGPPGTGKTDTLSFLLQSIIHEAQTNNKSRKILITGPNYRAVEELTERLVKNINEDPSCIAELFMIYSNNRIPKEISATNHHLKIKIVQRGSDDYGTNILSLRESIENPNKVTVVATTAHMVHRLTKEIYGRDSNWLKELYDFVIIDESSQVPLTLSLRPLTVLKASGQLVVAGDHLQMPPILSLDPPKNAEYLIGSIQTYLLERFGISSKNLLINYRSNQDIVDFAKSLDYPQGLTAFHTQRKLKLIGDLDTTISSLPKGYPTTTAYKELLLPDRSVTTLIHDDQISSQANEIEARMVAGLAFCLRHSMSKNLSSGNTDEQHAPFSDDEFFESGIGVVTPHKAQKSLVVKELLELFPNADPTLIYNAVDTVERFQGGERDTIIVSFGVGDTDIIQGEEEFLLQLERTNVSISRAKAKCIVLMTKALAYHLPTDTKAALTAQAIKSYTEEFCSNRLEVDIEYGGNHKIGEVRWH